MFGPLANGIATVLHIIINMLMLLCVASIVVSYIGDQSNNIVIMIRSITEPLYRPLRKLTRNLPGPFDWAPMIFMLILVFIQTGIIPYISMLGAPSAP